MEIVVKSFLEVEKLNGKKHILKIQVKHEKKIHKRKVKKN